MKVLKVKYCRRGLPGDHAVAGVGQDVDQEEQPEHRRLKHGVLSDEALEVLVLTLSLALQRGSDITHRLHGISHISIPETIMYGQSQKDQ